MSRKDEKQARPANNSKKSSTTAPSRRKPGPTAPKSESNLSIGGNVKNAVVMVFSGQFFSGGGIAKRIQQYHMQPLRVLFDLSWMCLYLSLIFSIGFLLFNFIYYGSSSTMFSNTISLLLFPKFENWGIKLLYAGGIIFLAGSLLQLFRSDKVRTSCGSFFFMAVLAIIAISVAKVGVLAKNLLIDLNYANALSRADEFVSHGQFEAAKEILLHYPEKDRVPSFTLKAKVARETPIEYSVPPSSNETDPALATLQNVMDQLYESGNYQEMIRTICSLSDTSLPQTELLIFWRSAAYVLAHDPEWGPERTLNWINEMNNQFPACQEFSSPFWLVVPPEIAFLIQEGNWELGRGQIGQLYKWHSYLPFDDPISETLPDTNIRDICKFEASEDMTKVGESTYRDYERCEYDMRLAADYLQRYPDDQYAGYAKFVLGNLDQIILEGYERNKTIYDLAYYEKGWREYDQGNYEAALKTFQGFLFVESLRNHPWRDDALWRAAMCYRHMGKYVDALQYLSRMENEGDDNVPLYADMSTNALYVADVLMPTNDLLSVVTQNLFPNLQPLLKYTLAERLLADGYYPGARLHFVEIGNQYQGQVSISPFGREYSYAELADQKIKVIEILTDYQKKYSDDANLYIADYLETYDAFSPFENELRYYLPMFSVLESEITSEYLTHRSKNYVAAELRENYLKQNPLSPQAPELLFKIAQSYETIASWADLPSSDDFLTSVRKKAVDAYLRYLNDYSELDTNRTDLAIEHAGSLYLSRCEYDYMHFWCDLESVQGMRNVYIGLVNKYPHHRLANNLLNWIAWSYCYEANQEDASDQQYVEAYTLALATYQKIAAEYSDGIIGENARANIPIIEEKILNPAVRVEPDDWGWPNPN